MRLPLAAVAAVLACLAVPSAALAAEDRRFPRGFLWGVATSGFQTEAGPAGRNADRRSDWWHWVHDPANINGGRVTPARPEDGPGYWSDYRRDHRRAARELRVGAFRLGVEWSRIFPRSTARIGGERITRSVLRRLDRLADRAAVRHYRAVLRDLRRRGLEPFLTVNHFTLPEWIHDPLATRDALAGLQPDAPLPPGLERAGWLDAGTVREFRKLAGYLAWKLGDLVHVWTPVNEPLVVSTSGYVNIPGVLSGNFPPGALSFTAAVTAVRNLEAANTAAYDAIKRFDRRARVGLVQSLVAWTPANPDSPADVRGAEHADHVFNRLFLDAAVRGDVDANFNGTIEEGERRAHGRKADFIGVNYYLRGRVTGLSAPLSTQAPIVDFLPATDYRSPAKPEAPPCPTTCSDLGSEIHPEGLRHVLRLAGSYGLPVYVTGNGIADADDAQRRDFLVDHLLEVHRAIRAGVDVRGYFHWSLRDNFEWAHGYVPRFGLYDIAGDARRSAAMFGRIARRNAIPGDLVERFG